MTDIRLDRAQINFKGEWLSADDLAAKIQSKMAAGEMKFAELAAALETLNNALENARTIETRLRIPIEVYERLKSLGGGSDGECIQQAVAAFIAAERPGDAGPRNNKKRLVVKCAKCHTPIEVPNGERPTEIRCPNCNAVGRLKT